MDVVYPFKSNGDDEELRYSLRSLKNLDHDRVFLVGDRPDWVQGVEWIETVQRDTKYKNVCANIAAACSSPEISDPFVIFNDDFFLMEPVEQIVPVWRESITESLARYRRRGMTEWLAHMMRIQHILAGTVSYELHVPMVVHKDLMLTAIRDSRPGPCWRTAYGKVADLGGDQLADVKVMKVNGGVPPGPFASCSDRAFREGLLGQDIRSLFPDASDYERPDRPSGGRS